MESITLIDLIRLIKDNNPGKDYAVGVDRISKKPTLVENNKPGYWDLVAWAEKKARRKLVFDPETFESDVKVVNREVFNLEPIEAFLYEIRSMRK